MTTPEPLSSPSLDELLSARAQRTPEDRLWIDIGGGALLLGAALWARPPFWPLLASGSAVLACYGLWAVATRRLRMGAVPSPRPQKITWRVIRSMTGVLGVAAFVAALFAALGIALGRLIS